MPRDLKAALYINMQHQYVYHQLVIAAIVSVKVDSTFNVQQRVLFCRLMAGFINNINVAAQLKHICNRLMVCDTVDYSVATTVAATDIRFGCYS